MRLGSHLGLLERKPEEWLAMRSEITGGAVEAAPIEDAEVEKLVAARIAARKARDFKESDRIRDQLAARGVVLEDGATGTTWRRK